ncbi:MAG TPA: ABC transporter ATP-binding protein [Chitinophagales bacterium]|nr:ABC transporter ATP-binding protein [Chitinophagales bacterium]
MILEATGIRKKYGALEVLKGVSLQVNKGEIVSLVGPSGAGKSTLLHIMGTLDKPDEGTVTIEGIEIFKQNENALSAFRNKSIGFIFQFHHLLPEFTAVENICIPAFIAGKGKAESEKRAKELLAMLNLSHRAEHKPSELSGGEQQRVAVARALINNPALIMADEPSGNLDTNNARELHKLFFELRDKLNQTFIIVTHNEELADMADRKVQMKDGLIINS